ncbi:MAG: hypothetical protein J6J42_08000 [Lachnospiraceae bacterium]|nr:hypothetical protein [Lachnospiraceae bacterium]
MTSRNSFFNLLKEDFRRRLWTFILSSLVFFGTFVIGFTMCLQNWVSQYGRWQLTEAEYLDRISADICYFLGMHPWFTLVAVVGAVICGVNGFAYLHSKKQMDFYHSLPVKRETIFAVRFVNGIMIYAIPYLVGLLYTFALSAVFGVMTSKVFYCGMFCFVLHLMGYIVMYLVSILAMLLTGKLVIAFFGIAVLTLYAPAVYGLVLTLCDSFFITLYSGSLDFEDALSMTRWFSPASYYYGLISALDQAEPKFWLEFLSFLLLAAVLTALSVWLYKKRPSEKADTAMSFKVTEPVIRVMIAVPVGILAGLLLFALQYDNGVDGALFWLIFGGLLGGFLAHAVIEALYKGDIRKCLSHKIQMLVTMVVSAVLPLCFFFDIFGYDSYLPEEKEIANMAVISSDMRFYGSYYKEDGWVSATNYALEEMKVTEFSAMYELATLLAEDANENRIEKFFGYNYTYQYVGGEEMVRNSEFIIRYTLKDGSEVIRSYEYNYYAVLDLLERIYEDEEVKTASHPIFSLAEAGWEPLCVACYSPLSPFSVQITGCEPLLKTYMSELMNLTFEELKNTAAIGELNVYFKVGNDSSYEDMATFLVYPSMTETIAMMKEHGYNLQSVQETDTIKSITVRYNGTINELKRALGMEVLETEQEIYINMNENSASWELYEEKGYLVMEEDYQEITIEFTDSAEIEAIKKGLVHSNYVGEFGPFPLRFGYFNAEVYFEVDSAEAVNGLIGWTDTFRFTKDGVPQFVIDRIFEELEAGTVSEN